MEGLHKALDHIDEVIALIKKSRDGAEAKLNLIKKFKFTEIQAGAILDMKLQKLAGLERQKIEDELNEILKFIKELKTLLGSVSMMLDVIKDELLQIKDKYADERRTKIVPGAVDSISMEDLIPQKEFAMVFTENGYIKRTDPTEYKSQKRGGVGVVDLDTKDDDIVTHFLTADSHANILFFSDTGKVYQTKMYDLPEGRRSTKGKSIKNFLPLTGEEKITSILPVPKGKDLSDISLFFTTRNGVVKRTSADAFEKVRSNGIVAIGLKDDDELLDVRFTHEDDQVMLITQLGQSIRFNVSDVRTMGRTAGGVKGMSLKPDDMVVGTGVVRADNTDDIDLLVITENGYGKKTPLSEYKIQGRGGSGIKTLNVTDKTGALIGGRIITTHASELIAMSQKSQVIRTGLEAISRLGRATQGVRIMKLRDGDSVASFTLV